MLAAARRHDDSPSIELTGLFHLPPNFRDGLQRIVDELMTAGCPTLSSIRRVHFVLQPSGRWIGIVPQARSR